MAPARKPGRKSARPAPTGERPRRTTARPARLQEPPGSEAPVQPRSRARRQLLPPNPPSVEPQAAVEPSTPLSSHEVPVASSPPDNGVLQNQILDLSSQVNQLKALLQAQSALATPSTSHQVVDDPPAVTLHPSPPPANATPAGIQDTTSPFVDAIRMLSDTGTLTSTPSYASEFIPMGFSKLDSSVSSELRAIIHSKKFINLEVLLPGRVGAVDFLFNQSMPHKVSVHSSKLKKFTSFDDWFDAYLIFSSVYVQQFPQEAQAILKHLSTVKRLHRQNFKWYDYDFEFRHFVASSSFSFDIYLPDLLERAKERPLLPQPPTFSSRKFQAGHQGAHKSFHVHSGFCFSFARGSKCRASPCKYKHECQFCGRSHPSSVCPERKQQQQNGARADKRDTYKGSYSSQN